MMPYALIGAVLLGVIATLYLALMLAGERNEAWMLASTVAGGLLTWGITLVKRLDDDEKSK